ncbi:hypothetical protein ACFV2H_42050 [Streptomyces sp. NPDC059629]|uniref:hypothetical protein n=1 Tax=Streptomyces sp. NPDC059629 TaxID=3346889 RepID=UPI0036A8A1E2
MNLARKLATGVIATGLVTVGLVAATPASARVYNNNCPSGGPTVVSYSGPDYCYTWDHTTGGNNNVGWMNLPNTKEVCPGGNDGFVIDTAGHDHYFDAGTPCTPTGGAWLQYIVFTG